MRLRGIFWKSGLRQSSCVVRCAVRPLPLPLSLLPGGKCFRMLSPAAATTCKRLIGNGFGVKIFFGKKLAAGLAVLGRFSATSYELRAASFQCQESDEGVHLPFCSGARVLDSSEPRAIERRGLWARLASGFRSVLSCEF